VTCGYNGLVLVVIYSVSEWCLVCRFAAKLMFAISIVTSFRTAFIIYCYKSEFCCTAFHLSKSRYIYQTIVL